jgi:hypothetical protein
MAGQAIGAYQIALHACASATCACSYALFPDQVLLAMIGKFGASTGWALGFIYAGELFPTSCRSSAVGVVGQSG